MIDYGRSALLLDYPTDPTYITMLEARSLGLTETDPYGNLVSLQHRQIQGQVPAENLIYLYNPIVTSQVYNASLYGVPMTLACLDAARTLKQIMSKGLGNLSENCYAGSFILTVRNQGMTETEKMREYNAVKNNLAKPGGVGILIENPEDVKIDQTSWEPEFEGMIKAAQHSKETIMQNFGLPQALLSEAITNRSSLLGLLQITLKVNVNP